MTTDQGTLVGLASEGNHPAMERLYLENKEKIFHLAYRYCGNSQDAEDLLQEIFARAFTALMKKKYRYRAEADFSTWLYRVGINYCISFLRKNKKHRDHLRDKFPGGAGDTLDKLGANGPGPEHIAGMEQMKQKVNVGLETLSPKQRMVFVLRFYQGYQIKDIADYMECSEGSVKKQLFRAVSRLREQLKNFKEGSS
ncbi:MAG: RNA polymerase sigma factor [bacterium]|nr:RNA polymerase sigma factor [bacterium]